MLGSSKLLIQKSLLTIALASQECRDAWIKSSRDLQESKAKAPYIQVAKMVAFPFS